MRVLIKVVAGRIVHAIDLLGVGEIPEGMLAIDFEGDTADLVLNHAYLNDRLVFVGEPPKFHQLDQDTGEWLPNLDAAREAKLQQVAVELNTRLYLSCNGFDADKTSRERISGMIARLQRGDGLPTGWVGWRDASNQQQWAADDAATVLANLTTLSRTIEDREQALLVASWAHKAAIDALEDIDAILAYDVTVGWPT